MQHSKVIFRAHWFKDHIFVLQVKCLICLLCLIMTWAILKWFALLDRHVFLWLMKCAIYPLEWVSGPTFPLLKLCQHVNCGVITPIVGIPASVDFRGQLGEQLVCQWCIQVLPFESDVWAWWVCFLAEWWQGFVMLNVLLDLSWADGGMDFFESEARLRL